MKCVLHFATKLNSRDSKTLQKSSQIEKLIVISAFSATGGMGCGGKVIWHKKVEQSFPNQSMDPPNQKFLDPPLVRAKIRVCEYFSTELSLVVTPY